MRKRQSIRGFTLTEVLVVLLIIGLIVGLVGPRVVGYLSSSRADTAEIQISQFSTALELYLLDTGRFPTQDEGLAALVAAPVGVSGWNGPYLRGGDVPDDPWGRAFVYSVDGNSYQIHSLGADGVEGGEGADADISG